MYIICHREDWSAVGFPGTDAAVALLTMGGETPQLPSHSKGSITATLPSDSPRANWLGSVGCDATTRGNAVELQVERLCSQAS